MRTYFTFILSLTVTFALAQVKSIPAVKISQHINIDGNLDEEAWKAVTPVSNFITSIPDFGHPSNHRTEVRILYDNTAVYVGAYIYDDPAKIRKQFTARDVISQQDVDYFLVGLDTYHDHQNAFVFRVTAAGVQGDARESQNGTNVGGNVFDVSWDAVWESKTSIKADGWVAEIRIPFSAIRFSRNPVQNWGLNFARFERSDNETSIWNPVNPNISGDINQWGNWEGLSNITPPLRLSLQPYVSGGFRVSPTAKGNITETLKSGGMDVKYGLNESFTLDMNLIPDFAQVQSDNTLLNLTPFEVKFDDYRPFFTEGTELFNKAGIFYSRRVGAAPGGSAAVLNRFGNDPNYRIVSNPGITNLYNASKFSGRTKGKLGIGIFNAASVPMYADVQNLTTGSDSSIRTEPFTNYNIIVLDQALKNRSSITFTNTNVLRQGNTRNANVSSLDVSMFDKKNLYNVSLAGRYSTIWGKNINKNGFNTVASFGKVSGLIQFNTGVSIKSDTYDPNDLGFLLSNNVVNYTASVSYILLKPTLHFLNHAYKLDLEDNYLFKPYTWSNMNLSGEAFFWFKNFWDISFKFTTNPKWSKDFFLNSTVYNGYFLKRPPTYNLSIFGSSDSRKKLFFNFHIEGALSPLPKDPYWNTIMGLRYRFSNKFQLSTSMTIEQDRGNWGWAFINNPNGSPVISRRDVKRNIAILSGQYNFNEKMNWTVRVRHYWSILNNTNFYNLKPDGYWTEIPFIPGRNINFNTFNIDMFYTWDFLPGSRITLAWKNALGNNVAIDPYHYTSYFQNLGKVTESPHSNELSVKLVYYLDYLTIRHKR